MKTTKFSVNLLNDLEKLDNWPVKVKLMQENWLGFSEGAEIEFELINCGLKKISVFTTRPETIFGASFLAVSIDHELSKFFISIQKFLAF